MINKNEIPDIKSGEKPIFPIPEIHLLSNGTQVYALNVGDQDLIKIDFIFDAGSVQAGNPILAETVNSLSDSGTKKYSSENIAEELDFYGAYLEKYSGHHKSKIVLYTLNKYFKQTLSLLSEIIYHPIFPEKEIELFIQNKYQNYLINRRKTEIVSNEIFVQSLFGKDHPYGKVQSEEDFKSINHEMIMDFHKKYYSTTGFKIIISGKISEYHYELMENYFGIRDIYPVTDQLLGLQPESSSEYKHFGLVDDTVQSSVKIGKITINKKHSDFFKLNITSILLGGYFGSRLMKNIREDKGYTYGIYASNTSLLRAGFFSISAETGKHVYEKAIDEIYKELKRLRTETIPNSELIRVKNWISGNMLKAFDGPFALSETLSSILDYDLDFGYYDTYFETITSITAETIRTTAEMYLHEEDMYEIVVGSR